MKKFTLLVLSLIICFTVAAQQSVSIGSTSVKSNAVLWLNSPGKNQGLIIPVVTSRNTITSPGPEAGMVVYDETDKLVYFYNGTTWISTGGSASVISVDNATIQNTSGTLSVKDGGITTTKISPSAVNGQVLTTTGGAVTWTTPITSDNTTIQNTSGILSVKDAGVTTVKISPSAVNGQVLTTTAGAVTWSTPSASTGTVKNVSASAPLTVTTPTTTPAIAITQATTTTDGYLSTADWNTFNSKLNGNILTTTGDLLFHNGTSLIRLPKGTNGQVLSSTASTIQWSAPTGFTNPMTTLGDIIMGGAGGTPVRLAGASGFLKSTGAAAPTWSTITGSDLASNIAISTTGNITTTGAGTIGSASLAGTGTRMVTATSTGVLGTQAIPSTYTNTNVVPKGSTGGLIDSQLFDDGTNVGVGTTSPASKLDVNGFTKLGSTAPPIQTMVFTVAAPGTQGGCLATPFTVPAGTIIGIQVMLEYNGSGSGSFIQPAYIRDPGYEFNWVIAIPGSFQICAIAGNSGNILNKPGYVFITYQP